MSELSERTLLQRVAQLERESRHSKRLSWLSTLALIAVTGIGAGALHSATTQPIVVRATSGLGRTVIDGSGVHVYDAQGKLHVTLGSDGKLLSGLILHDSHGNVRFEVNLDPTSEYARLYLDRDISHATLALFGSSKPAIALYTGSNQRRIYLGQSLENDPLLLMSGESGADRVRIAGSAQPTFVEATGASKQRVRIGVFGNTPGMALSNAAGSTRIIASGGEAPFIRYYTGTDTSRIELGVTAANDTGLDFYDPSGTENITLQGGTGPFLRMKGGSVERVYLGVYSTNATGLDIFNNLGTRTWGSP
ncbi:MAG TPA: hypothetical protein VMV73_02140 [Candidatus Dormibacteraeota bacterium]|nr:hypothetical protein [Candidatus Dormibacteraeota bacterium]